MNTLDTILKVFYDEEFLKAEGFDDAVIGVEYNSMRLVYSISKILCILMDEGMTLEEAEEHFDYNIAGGYVGERTPIWIHDEL